MFYAFWACSLHNGHAFYAQNRGSRTQTMYFVHRTSKLIPWCGFMFVGFEPDPSVYNLPTELQMPTQTDCYF